jgi:dihydroorotate dehydrogenase
MLLPYESLVRPLMFRLDPEQAHAVAMAGLRRLPGGLIGALGGRAAGRPVTLFGVTFPNPVGLAAGFDKNAEALPGWEALGFGFVEVGTITAHAQPGNPKPRVFRIPSHGALINRMGFNNDGADAVAARLEALRASGRWPSIPVGINLGKSKVTPLEEAAGDYLASFDRLAGYADYIAVNVSSPNTPNLRKLQDRGALDALLLAIMERNAGRKPVLLKIAPDLSWEQIDDVLGLIEARGLAGLIATNTTVDHASVPEGVRQQGGLSGRPLRERSTEVVRYVAERTRLPVIGVGGIESAEGAREKFDAGASLVQLYTGFIYRGPALIASIVRERAARG